MNDDTDTSARPVTCAAAFDRDGFVTCDRCGAAWHTAGTPPTCNPMGKNQLRNVLLGEAAALEGTHHSLIAMRDAGMPADPVDPLRRATALRGVLLFVDRCLDSPRIMDELRRIAQAKAREAEAEATGDAEHD